uniref:Uncharacterized protein n=1 Tax=Solibacter usitatus (strain Ellin6076) TaxID=234267 RepID=Q021G3_SOLUE
MKHYAIDEWVDFTRGTVAGDDAAQMLAHLRSGCMDCGRLSEFTSKLSMTCTGLASAEVPEASLRLARAIFPVRMQDRSKRGNRLPIEMIFDSFLVPSAAGLRSTWQVGWQGLYRAGDCSVDLRIEPELKSTRAAVIGQISSHVQPAVEMGDLPVCLRAGKLVVAETRSNRFGEFQMEYDQQTQLKLCIYLRDSKSIQVPLKKFTSDQPAVQSQTGVRSRSEEQ